MKALLKKLQSFNLFRKLGTTLLLSLYLVTNAGLPQALAADFGADTIWTTGGGSSADFGDDTVWTDASGGSADFGDDTVWTDASGNGADFGDNDTNTNNGNTTGGSIDMTTTTTSSNVTLIGTRNQRTDSVLLLYDATTSLGNSNSINFDICLREGVGTPTDCLGRTTNVEYFYLTGLKANTTYSWNVRLRDGIGQRFASNGHFVFTTPASNPGNTVPSLSVVGSPTELKTNRATIQVQSSDTEGHSLVYDICYTTSRYGVIAQQGNRGFNSEGLSNCAATSVSKEMTLYGLERSTTYFWTIRARESNSSQGYVAYPTNGVFFFTTPASDDEDDDDEDDTAPNNIPTVSPTAPTNGTILTSGATSLQATVTDSDDSAFTNTIYVRQVLATDATTYSHDDIKNNATSTFTVSGSSINQAFTGTAGNKYWWTVETSDGEDTGRLTAPQNFRVNTAPTVTQALPANANVETNTAVTLTWSGVDSDPEALTYEVYVLQTTLADAGPYTSTDIINTGTLQALVPNTNTSLAFTAPADNARYYWTVRVNDTVTTAVPVAAPFFFDVNTANDAPTVTLTAPTDTNTVTNTAVTITWAGADLDNDALTYELFTYERPLTDAGPYTNNDVITNGVSQVLAPNTVTTFNFTATDNMRYYWTVRANDGTTTGLPAAPFRFDVNTANNAPVVTLVSPANTNTETNTAVTINWSATDADIDPITYELFTYERPLADNGPYTNNDIITNGVSQVLAPNTVTTFNFTATDNMRYFWTVRASDGTTTSLPAAGPFFFNVNTTNNAPVVTLTGPATASTSTVTAVPLSWSATDADANPITYELFVYQRPLGDAGPYTDNDIVTNGVQQVLGATTDTSFVFNGVDNARYYWTVRANDTFTNAFPASGPFFFDINAANDAPTVTLTAPADTNTETATAVTITWAGADLDNDALTYELFTYERPLTDAGPYTNNDVITNGVSQVLAPNTVTTFNFTATDNMRYYWTVRANDGTTTGLPAAPFRFDVNTANNAPVVTLTGPADANVATANPINITWGGTDADLDTLNYELFILQTTLADAGPYTDAQIVATGVSQVLAPTTVTSFVFNAPADNARYYWTVRANDGTTTSLPGAPRYFDFNTANDAPAVTLTAPADTNVETSTNVTISWNGTDLDNDTLTYELFVFQTGLADVGPYTDANIVATGTSQVLAPNTVTTFNFTGADAQRYYWTVRASDGTTTSLPGAPRFFDINTAANNAPTITLNTPVNANVEAATPVNMAWTSGDVDGNPLTHVLHIYQVPLNDATVYTNNQVQTLGTQQTLGTPADVAFSFAAADNARYWWTVSVTDGIATTLPAAPLFYDVNTANDAPTVTLVSPTNGATGGTQTLTWTGADLDFNALTYDVFVLTVPQGDATPQTDATVIASGTQVATATAATTFAFAGANTNDYWWTVRANDGTTTGLPGAPFRFNGQVANHVVVPNGGSGGGGGGGVGGSNTSTNTGQVVSLPLKESDNMITVYSPISFKNSKGEALAPIRHIDLGSRFEARWDKNTKVETLAGNTFLGKVKTPLRLKQTKIPAVAQESLPELETLYPYFIQYGNLNEKYDKPVTLSGKIPTQYLGGFEDAKDFALVAYNAAEKRWEKVGDMNNIRKGRFSIDLDESTVFAFADIDGVDLATPADEEDDSMDEEPTDEDTTDDNTDEDTSDDDSSDQPLSRDPHTLCTTGLETSLFPDVKDHWAKYYICRLNRAGAIRGYVAGEWAGLFKPDVSVTRAELLKVMISLHGYDLQGINTTGLFTDMNGDEWYAPYVAKAKELGIVNGYEDGSFKPGIVVNRAEALKMIILSNPSVNDKTIEIQRAVEFADSDDTVGLNDVTEEMWFAPYVSYALTRGIISGKSDGKFHGGDAMTRAELSKVGFLSWTSGQ